MIQELSDLNAPASLPKHFFRREYANLVALLSRRIGVHHIEAIEDAMQSALMTALEQWGHSGAPGNPSAWLYRESKPSRTPSRSHLNKSSRLRLRRTASPPRTRQFRGRLHRRSV